MNEQEMIKSAQAIKEIRENMPLILDHFRLQAQMSKARYDELVRTGFTPEQALFLCSKI
ncbi:MAG TPA: hypothetical protein VJ654_14125 [Noviherbaspirillum sp.]|nr:hypothetical protein [Noviherbaspirillum sp.]